MTGNEMFSPAEITTDGFIQTEEGIADVVGSEVFFYFGGEKSQRTILFAALNTDIECPRCQTRCIECVILKTEAEEILACRNCNEFVMIKGEDENE